MHSMLLLTKPATQDRLNAAVVEIIGLNVTGSVCIPVGAQMMMMWDAGSTLRYAERRLKQSISLIQDSERGGVYFQVDNKLVCFCSDGVVEIHTLLENLLE